MKKIKIGRITGAQGLRGEVKMHHDSGEEEALGRLTSLFLGSEPGAGHGTVEYIIEKLRMQKRTPVFKLKGIEDRSSAEALVGLDVFADEDEARPEGEDAWFASELVGMKVRIVSSPEAPDDDGDAARGDEETAIASSESDDAIQSTCEEYRVKSVIKNPAHDILEVETPQGVKMLPFVDAFIREVDTKTGCITIIPPEGW